jgi:hypothetical protein
MRATGLLAIIACAHGAQESANPIRKVVTMLQTLQSKVQAEGAKEKELYDKYMCYCKNAGGDLAKSIADAEAKGPQLASAIEEAEGKLSQLKSDIVSHQNDRAAAKTAMEEATALRNKENAAYTTFKDEADANIAAIGKATAAIEKGSGSFLQTSAAQLLRNLVQTRDMYDSERQDMMAFLTTNSEYAPASGQVVGILKTMHDEISKDLSDATNTENSAVSSYDELMAAKKKEVLSLSGMIEKKLTRVGNLGVEIQQMRNDAGDTAEGLVDDKKFLADLDNNCAQKQKLYEENTKYRSEELAALADTIKILNDDDALELFKKTLPGASASLLQVRVTANSMRTRALDFIDQVKPNSAHHTQLDFISLALHGKKIGFEKVIGMIDDLVSELKTEQQDDENKKEYCAAQLDQADDKKKGLQKQVSDLETAIAESKEGIATTKEEIDALGDGIRALDKAVAEATEQRKDENEDFKTLMASDAAAKELINFAKNRLNKFYNPKLYKPPALAQVHLHQQDAPPPPPESIQAYKKSGEESNGIIAMMDALVADLDKEMTEAEVTEKDAQGDYEQMMKDSAAKRAEDSKSLTDKEAALADLQAGLQSQTDGKASAESELQATNQYIHSLHLECDWLLKYFDMRKEARTNEIDALEKAKAVLSGADFSLVQTNTRNFLSRN